MSIKYVYLKDMKDEILASLDRLESALFQPDDPSPDDILDRLRRISRTVLTANEKKYNIKTEEGDSFDSRIQRVKEVVVSRIEQQMDIIPHGDQNMLDRVRVLFNAVDRIVQDELENPTEYEHKLWKESQNAARDLYDDLWRVLQFIAIYAEYVRETMTVSRFMDVLCLLEKEVFDVRRMWGPRKARVKVGEPLNLKDHYSEYKTDKRGVSRDITMDLETSVRDMLKELSIDQTLQ
jgi:hypothetical protein